MRLLSLIAKTRCSWAVHWEPFGLIDNYNWVRMNGTDSPSYRQVAPVLFYCSGLHWSRWSRFAQSMQRSVTGWTFTVGSPQTKQMPQMRFKTKNRVKMFCFLHEGTCMGCAEVFFVFDTITQYLDVWYFYRWILHIYSWNFKFVFTKLDARCGTLT